MQALGIPASLDLVCGPDFGSFALAIRFPLLIFALQAEIVEVNGGEPVSTRADDNDSRFEGWSRIGEKGWLQQLEQ